MRLGLLIASLFFPKPSYPGGGETRTVLQSQGFGTGTGRSFPLCGRQAPSSFQVGERRRSVEGEGECAVDATWPLHLCLGTGL